MVVSQRIGSILAVLGGFESSTVVAAGKAFNYFFIVVTVSGTAQTARVDPILWEKICDERYVVKSRDDKAKTAVVFGRSMVASRNDELVVRVRLL